MQNKDNSTQLPNPWQVISSRIVYENPWVRMREDQVITPTGKDGIYGVLESKDSVLIVVLNEKNEILLVRTFSYPSESWNWELPGGGGENEDTAKASARELEEETGIRAQSWEALGTTRVCNGLMTERMAVYIARDLSFDGEKEVGDEQVVDSGFFSLDEIYALIDRHEINDNQTMTGIYLFERWLAKSQALQKEKQ